MALLHVQMDGSERFGDGFHKIYLHIECAPICPKCPLPRRYTSMDHTGGWYVNLNMNGTIGSKGAVNSQRAEP